MSDIYKKGTYAECRSRGWKSCCHVSRDSDSACCIDCSATTCERYSISKYSRCCRGATDSYCISCPCCRYSCRKACCCSNTCCKGRGMSDIYKKGIDTQCWRRGWKACCHVCCDSDRACCIDCSATACERYSISKYSRCCRGATDSYCISCPCCRYSCRKACCCSNTCCKGRSMSDRCQKCTYAECRS